MSSHWVPTRKIVRPSNACWTNGATFLRSQMWHAKTRQNIHFICGFEFATATHHEMLDRTTTPATNWKRYMSGQGATSTKAILFKRDTRDGMHQLYWRAKRTVVGDSRSICASSTALPTGNRMIYQEYPICS